MDNPFVISLPDLKPEFCLQTMSEVYDWGLLDLNIPNVHKQTMGEGIKVGIVDSGKSEHFETVHATLDWKNFTDSPVAEDRQGHSTFIAGIIAANKNNEGVIGVAPKCKLIFAKSMNDSGTGSPAAMTNAVLWLIGKKVDIISISAGMFFDFKPLHKAIKLAFKKNTTIVAATGNCLSKGSRIKTINGWKNIEDIQKGDTVYAFSMEDKELILTEVTNTFAKMDTVYKIRTFTRTINATANHRFLCATSRKGSNNICETKRGNETIVAAKTQKDRYFYEWKELQDITVGDFILIDENSDYKIEDKSVGLDTLYLYGVMLGDGWLTLKYNEGKISRDRFGISTPINSPHTDYLLSLTENMFGKKLAQNKSQLDLYSRKICQKWAKMFPNLLNKNSHTKRVDPWIFRLPKSKKIAVIQGYLDSDGYIHNGNIVFESCNKHLIEDVYELCIRSGIKTTNIRERTRETNFGFITSFGFSITNYNDTHTISSRHPYKKEKLKKHKCSEGERKYNYRINSIVEQSNVTFDRVQSIEEVGDSEVFDLEVPRLHNFIANNIIVHNSGKRHYDVAFPARYPEVIGVAAYNKKHQVAKFSSRGINVMFAMPGVDVYSSHLNNQFVKSNGTSYACPILSGICALILSPHRKVSTPKTPCETPQQMMEHLQKYAVVLDNKRSTGFGTLDTEGLFSTGGQ